MHVQASSIHFAGNRPRRLLSAALLTGLGLATLVTPHQAQAKLTDPGMRLGPGSDLFQQPASVRMAVRRALLGLDDPMVKLSALQRVKSLIQKGCQGVATANSSFYAGNSGGYSLNFFTPYAQTNFQINAAGRITSATEIHPNGDWSPLENTPPPFIEASLSEFQPDTVKQDGCQ